MGTSSVHSVIERSGDSVKKQLTNVVTAIQGAVWDPKFREAYNVLDGKRDTSSLPSLKLLSNYIGRVDSDSIDSTINFLEFSQTLKLKSRKDLELIARFQIAKTADALSTVTELINVNRIVNTLMPNQPLKNDDQFLIKLRDQLTGQLTIACAAYKTGEFLTPATLAAAAPIVTNGNYLDEIRHYGSRAIQDGIKLINSANGRNKLSKEELVELSWRYYENNYSTTAGNEMEFTQAGFGGAVAIGSQKVVSKFAMTAAGATLLAYFAKNYPTIAATLEGLSRSSSAAENAAAHAARRRFLPDTNELGFMTGAGATVLAMSTLSGSGGGNISSTPPVPGMPLPPSGPTNGGGSGKTLGVGAIVAGVVGGFLGWENHKTNTRNETVAIYKDQTTKIDLTVASAVIVAMADADKILGQAENAGETGLSSANIAAQILFETERDRAVQEIVGKLGSARVVAKLRALQGKITSDTAGIPIAQKVDLAKQLAEAEVAFEDGKITQEKLNEIRRKFELVSQPSKR